MNPFRAAALAILLIVAFAARAHGDAHTGRTPAATTGEAEQQPFGIAGDPGKVARAVTLDMDDRMRFTPPRIPVRLGETIRFVIRNRGNVLHEMVIGTRAGLREHAELMRKFPGMVHVEPHMAHIGPGQTGEIVWHFNRPGAFDFACLLPGHFEAGMKGAIVVE